MGSELKIEAAAGTHPGKIRSINQDSVLAFVRPESMGEASGLFIVADGMGGHQAGDVASQIAVKTIRENLAWLLTQDDETATIISPSSTSDPDNTDEMSQLETRLKLAIQEANQAIYSYARTNPTDAGNMGCTVTCVIVMGDKAVVANVGDSRTYLLGRNGLVQITDDHSYVGQLVRDGHLEVDEVYDHPQRNVITRALGSLPEVSIDTWSCSVVPGDRFLLCSDGVWEMIRDPEEIESILRGDDLEIAVNQMIDAANNYGGADNIGLVIAEIQSL